MQIHFRFLIHQIMTNFDAHKEENSLPEPSLEYSSSISAPSIALTLDASDKLIFTGV